MSLSLDRTRQLAAPWKGLRVALAGQDAAAIRETLPAPRRS